MPEPIKPEEIQFDAVTHAYRVRGEVWPNVTSIIEPLTGIRRDENGESYLLGISREVWKAAADFGIAVHRMVDLYAKNDLDEVSLDPVLVRVLTQFRKAINQKPWAYQTELRVAHAALRYCGTADLVASDAKGGIHVVDIKTSASAPATVGLQTAAYAHAWQSADPEQRPLPRRYCLLLAEDAFRWLPQKDQLDWTYFLSALNTYKWKAKHGIH